MIMINYVADELANKVYHLTKALNKAENIVKILEQENNNLKKILDKLYCTNHDLDCLKKVVVL